MDERIPKISRPLLLWFRWIVRRNFRAAFHAVRLAGVDRLPTMDAPLLVYANHCSWWDPMVAFLLASKLMRTVRALCADGCVRAQEVQDSQLAWRFSGRGKQRARGGPLPADGRGDSARGKRAVGDAAGTVRRTCGSGR